MVGAGKGRGPLPLEQNFHLGKAAGRRAVNGGDNRVKMLAHQPPRRLTQHDDRDFPVGKVLLIAHIFVGRHQQIETRVFSKFKQRSL